jgi:hypothetical protein
VRPRSLRSTALLGITAAWLALALSPARAAGADRTNLPLRNWGGFSVHRDAVYDDLERLVTAGLADRVLLNTKPLSRLEAARMVARAIEKIRHDDVGAYNARRDLEPVLDRLIEEFRSELASLGVKFNGEAGPAPGFVAFLPVDRAQVGAAYSSRDFTPVNSQGRRFEHGLNAGTTFESRLQVGDVLTLYAQPALLANEETGAARLQTGYLKLTVFNVELLVGRDSLWWGPALHGSLILSNNAPPLDQIRIGAAEPFRLPWIGEWVGPMKILLFIAQLEERRDHPRAKLSGMRATVTPFSFLELGVSRTIMFDGTDSPRLDASEYPRAIFYPAAGDERTREAKFRNNNVFAVDADLRLRDVSRFLVPARDLRLYGEFGWDDTCCNTNFVPLRDAVSGLVGLQLIRVFGYDELEARVEYARSSRLSFVHDQFVRGYWTRGEVISHVMGTGGEEYFARVTNRLTPTLMLGLELNRARIGDTGSPPGADERRLGGALDLSYRFKDRYSLFARYELSRVDNRNFKSGDDGFDHLLRLELTRSFR